MVNHLCTVRPCIGFQAAYIPWDLQATLQDVLLLLVV